MSIVESMALNVLDSIGSDFNFTEVKGVDGPFMRLTSSMSDKSVGSARILKGSGSEKLVYIGLKVEAFQLDSHMVFSFADEYSSLPHFTLDAVHVQDHYAFHLDLIPRMELATHLDYMNAVYDPLTSIFKETTQYEGLEKAHLTPVQISMMSPWMLAYRCHENLLEKVQVSADYYLSHWKHLRREGVKISAQNQLGPNQLAAHDKIHRSALFSRKVDPVWDRIDGILGHEQSEQLRCLLLS